jgi:cardiolipin synthase
MSYSQWATEKLYLDNDDYYRDLIQEVDSAHHSIDMEVFTFEDGVLARRLLETFKQAIARGVSVRLITDGWGSPLFWETIGPQLEAAGVKIRLHRSLPWRRINRHSHGEPRSRIGKFWFRLRRINRGFHRKVTLIDRRIAWVSSLNVTDVHLKEVYGKNAWADVGARFTGQAVGILGHAFDRAFYRRRWLLFAPPPPSSLILLNDSFFRRRRTMFVQKRRLKRAQRRIWIQTPYFVPERSLLRALYHAAKRKIDIKVLIPEKNDQPIVKILTFALLGQLIRKGIRIFEFQPRFAHKKVLMVDHIHTIGSTNFNHRSFLHDLEVEVHLSLPENRALLEKSFQDDLTESIEITREWIRSKPWWYRVLGRVLFFMRYWC